MRESTTWQLIFQEGEAQGEIVGMRNLLRFQGAKRFGPPSAAVEAALTAITDPRQLQDLSVRLLDAADWQDLLPTTSPKRRGRKQTAP